MGYAAMVVLVKDPGSGDPREIMDELVSYHSSDVAKKRQVASRLRKSRKVFKCELNREINDFLIDSERKILYFGINGAELKLVLK